MACSLASRIALMEAGIEARYHLVHLRNEGFGGRQRFPQDLAEGRRAAAGAGKRRAPEQDRRRAAIHRRSQARTRAGAPPGDPDRYRLQEWLNFVGSKIHKSFLYPTFWYKEDAAKASARARIGGTLSVAAGHLDGRAVSRRRALHRRRCLFRLDAAAGDRPLRDRIGAVAVTGCLSRAFQARPQVKAAVGIEMQLRETMQGKSALSTRPSRPARGALRERHERGAGCGGRGLRADATAAMRRRRNRVVLTPRELASSS